MLSVGTASQCRSSLYALCEQSSTVSLHTLHAVCLFLLFSAPSAFSAVYPCISSLCVLRASAVFLFSTALDAPALG